MMTRPDLSEIAAQGKASSPGRRPPRPQVARGLPSGENFWMRLLPNSVTRRLPCWSMSRP